MHRFATPRIGLVGLLQVDWMKLVTRKFSEESMKTRKHCNLSKASLVVHSGRQTSLSRLFPLLVTVTPATCSTCGRTCASHIGLYVIKDVVDDIRHIDDSVHHHHHHHGWRFGVAVTRWSRSTQLLYIEPVVTGMGDCFRANSAFHPFGVDK